MDQVLLYFVKYPEPGKVKTRLAKTVGLETAAAIYRRLARDIFLGMIGRAQHVLDYDIIVYFDPPDRENKIREWLPGAAGYWPQRGGDLGERLTEGFREAFGRGSRRVAALGSDTLGLKESWIGEAFQILRNHDGVLGPSRDGGYYLIGLTTPNDEVFQRIPWSTGEVLRATQSRLYAMGLTFQLLPELDDLDDEKNLDRLKVLDQR